jgi:poly-beta-1,6-N-acetyl-D-glucosamine synthase
MSDLLREAQPFFCGLLAICASVYGIGVVWFLSGMKIRAGKERGTPFVSVVVAARNEADNIRACLCRLLHQDYPEECYEVIVVDDGSSDGTPEIALSIGEGRKGFRLLSVEEEGGKSGSKKAALSLGIEAAGGAILLTTDADCRVPEGWIKGMVGHFSPEVGLVAGFSQIGPPGGPQSPRTAYEAVDFLCLMGCILGSIGRGHPMAASGQNLAYRKEAFQEVGGFARVAHRASGDDVLLLQLIKRFTNWEIAFAGEPGTFVVHPASSSWGGLFQQRTRWASNAPSQLRLDPSFFAYMVVTFALDLLLLMSPLWVLWGDLRAGWAIGGWGVKILAEWALFLRGTVLFGRRDLRRYFPLWALLQPFHVVMVGVIGCLGVFSWKGKSHRWGRQRSGEEKPSS